MTSLAEQAGCSGKREDFKGIMNGSALLDHEWKCRKCGLLAIDHPEGNVPAVARGNISILSSCQTTHRHLSHQFSYSNQLTLSDVFLPFITSSFIILPYFTLSYIFLPYLTLSYISLPFLHYVMLFELVIFDT